MDGHATFGKEELLRWMIGAGSHASEAAFVADRSPALLEYIMERERLDSSTAGPSASSSEDLVPESTDAASPRTVSSALTAERSEVLARTQDAAPPSSTRTGPKFSFDVDEPLDNRTREVLMTIGGVVSGGFTSQDAVSLWLIQLINMGLKQEALAIAEGFSRRRPAFMHEFMG
jgi:hypothetical protein